MTRLLLPALLLLTVATAAPAQKRKGNAPKKEQDVTLHGATVVATRQQRVNNSALNAVAVDVTQLKNTTLDLAGVLDKVSGVKIRQDGGVGSAAQINLNGFTGKHVKVFMDGVPMDGSASSFSLHNIPAGLAGSIEVYKGVVPVEFGGDALGGAVNIVTNQLRGTFLDASYSFGSFQTHKASVVAGHTTDGGFTVRLNAYMNHSLNDYKVKTQNTDLQTLVISPDEAWYRRFHDRYRNEAVVMQTGFVGRPWADRLLLGLTYSHENAQIQHANLLKIVFGGKYRTAEGFTPHLVYAKRNFLTERLDVNLSAKYDVVTTHNVDTLARTYNWKGEYVEKPTQGEGVATIAAYRGKTATVVTGVKYRWWRKHFLTLNDTYSNYTRRTTEAAANASQQSAATFMRRTNVKNVLGVEYKYLPSETWNVLLMAKHYRTDVRGPVNVSTVAGRYLYEEQTRNNSAVGYGFAGTYRPWTAWQFKASFEKTLRLPNVRELFGDGDYEQGEATLRPEKSYNVNVNLTYEQVFAGIHQLRLEAGLNNRNIRDYIIRTINDKGIAVSTNHGKVFSIGADFSARYAYKDCFELNAAYAVQNMRNRERYAANGAVSVTYNNRVPNVPYSFGNADASYSFRRFLGDENVLTLSYGIDYMHRFFRSWEGDGAKIYIPRQVSHNASVVYSLAGGRYNIAFEANNFTDAILYDNYSLQKPGRNFNVKFRYVFYKRNKN